MATNSIIIRNLRLRTRIGIREWEHEKEQDIVLNIRVEHDRVQAGRTDDIADGFDYKTIKDQIVALVDGSEHDLLESLAEAVADLCLKADGALRVHVEIDKPGALRFADSVAVAIDRP